jgi:phage terminase small subunit
MYASECRRYAEQCLQLAQELGPQHRDRLLEWADEWRRVAEELEELEPEEEQDQQ